MARRHRAGGRRRRRLEQGILLIPSLLTTANLFAGFYSIVAVLNGRIAHGAVAILVAILCDVLDGKVAKLARASTDFGVEYDSLADLVSFGLAPALLLYRW
ncbi:MAG: CDP-alcohol phosphatidyltransferase family protein, partial [Nitrospinota bacterium]